MKYPLLYLLLFSILFACKKDKKNVSDETQYIPHGNMLKSERRLITGPTSTLVSFIKYTYNSLGQLSEITKTDSSFENQKWTSLISGLQTFSYTSFNKISKRNYNGLTYNSVYDTNQRLLYEYNDAWISDTSKYSYNGLNIKKTNKRFEHEKITVVSFYGQNLDSVLTYDSLNTLKARTVKQYNTKIDLTKEYLNKFFSVPENTSELIKSETKDVYSNYGYNGFSRTYDQQGYPIKETVDVNGASSYYIYFSYY